LAEAIALTANERQANVRLDRDYVLGTHEEEARRLGIQHEAWRPIALECWRRAGVRRGQRVIDVGAGPGFAAFDLAGIVGRRGSVTAIERSARFVEAGRAEALARGAGNVDFVELDLMSDSLPGSDYDAAWCRWVTSFVESPEVLVDKVASAVGPRGVVMFHEYVDYASWRFSPSLPLVEDYIAQVMQSWRSAGGQPDVAMRIPPRLLRRGFILERAEPLVFCVRPGEPLWRWIATFVESNVQRLVELGDIDPSRAEAVKEEFHAAERSPATLMLTPMVMEVVARRPDRAVPAMSCCAPAKSGPGR